MCVALGVLFQTKQSKAWFHIDAVHVVSCGLFNSNPVGFIFVVVCLLAHCFFMPSDNFFPFMCRLYRFTENVYAYDEWPELGAIVAIFCFAFLSCIVIVVPSALISPFKWNSVKLFTLLKLTTKTMEKMKKWRKNKKKA